MRIPSFFFLGLIFLLLSCKSEPADAEYIDNTNDLKVEVKLSSGSMVDRFEEIQVPTFFNLGSLPSGPELNNIIIPGDQIKKGKVVSVKPLSAFSFVQDSVVNQFIVVTPLDSTFQGLESNNFLDFMVKEADYKNLIENWFRLNCELGSCSDFKWESEIKVKSLIQSYMNKQSR